ncbi:MAG: nicotinate-nucleotide--dimethylbenzimidazole phosphoribosyltransferase, partial [Selenomonas sp.]|nr:nicotinate-nucleotide--dimethylbenzimidazole phosphoribosyltransferase [Selenomonas sp.]
MSLLQATIEAITPADGKLAAQAGKQLAAVMEGDEQAFGKFKDLLLRYIAITGELHPASPDKSTVICCASHGV